jgi:hypothetical protein
MVPAPILTAEPIEHMQHRHGITRMLRPLILGALLLHANIATPCINPTAFGTVAAPTTGVAVTISTCTFQNEYNTITGVVAGATYQITSSCGGYITVRRTTPGGVIAAQGNAPLSFTAPAAGTYYIHYTTNAACGTASTCCTTAITCTSCGGGGGGGGCINLTAFGSIAAPTTNTAATINTCTYQSEYNTITGVVAGASYQVTSTCGGYVTVRHTTPGGVIVAQGNAPLTFTATVAGTYYIHYNTSAACGTASTCCTTAISCTSCGGGGGGGCTNTTLYGSIVAPTTSTPTTISACNFQGEYSTITSVVAGSTYQVSAGACGGYITVRQNTFNGPVVAQGASPLTFAAPAAGTYFVHYNTNAACGTASICCNTTIACTSCSGPVGCVNSIPYATVLAPTSNTPITIDGCSFQTEYSTINGVVAGTSYSIGSSCGGYITVRQGTFNGPVAAMGNAPLSFVAPSSGTFYVHWNTNAACGTASTCCITTMTCTNCTASGCVNSIPFGTAAAPNNATPVTISNCNYQTEYSTITGMLAGETYIFGSSCGGFVTIRSTTPGGPLVASGNSPLSFTPLVGGTYYVHWNTNDACGTDVTCCITTLVCPTCLGTGTGGIQIQQNLTPVQLISERFLGECLSASNVTFTGATTAVGTFSNGWAIGIQDGIIITTGSALAALGPNNIESSSTTNASGGNALLTSLAGQPTDDAAVFQFTFVPETDEVTFTYVFASDEYPEFVCSTFNDVFGFFISGPGYAANTNVALIPGSTLPVAINTVNPGVIGTSGIAAGCTSLAYPGLYVNNVGGTHNQYDGFTVPLTVTIATVPCQAYTITIAVADAGDTSYDSAVFLKAQSFSAGVDLAIETDTDGAASSPVNCATEGAFVFTIDQPLTQALTLTYLVTQAGSATFSPPVPIQVTFPVGSTSVSVPVSALPASLGTNLSTLTITLDTSPYEEFGCTCTPGAQILDATLYFCDPIQLPVRWLGFDALPDPVARRVECQWSTAAEMNSATFTLERSTDRSSWKELGALPGQGTSNHTNTYRLIDQAPPRGTIYYRIRQNDMDGQVGYSEIRTVHLDIPALGAFPNPSEGTFSLQGHAGGVVRVLDMSGRQVAHLLEDGGLTLPDAVPGCYILEVAWPSGPVPERVRLVVE